MENGIMTGVLRKKSTSPATLNDFIKLTHFKRFTVMWHSGIYRMSDRMAMNWGYVLAYGLMTFSYSLSHSDHILCNMWYG